MQQQRKPTGQRVLVENLIWFLGSLGLAFLVWMTAVSQSDPVEQWRLPERVPIRIQAPPGLIITNQASLTATAAVQLRSSQSLRQLITAEDVVVWANLEGLEPGTHVVPLQAQVAQGARVENISPSQITVSLELEAAQLVPVRERIINPPPPDLEIASIRFDALQAEVSGPQSRVAEIVAVEVPLNLQGQRGTFVDLVRAVAVNADGDIVTDVTINPYMINVTVEMQPSETVREVNVRPILEGELPEGYFITSFTYDPQSVFVAAPIGRVETIPDVFFTVPIDLTDRTADFTLVVPIDLPDELFLLVNDPYVTVSVGVSAQTVTRQFDSVEVSVVGAREGFTYRLDPSRVALIITGPQPLLDTMTSDMLRVAVDVTGLGASTSYRLTAVAQGAPGTNVTVLPSVIDVDIFPPPATETPAITETPAVAETTPTAVPATPSTP